MNKKVVPYDENGNKTDEIREMFDNISGRYDFLNDILSLGCGRIWRNKAVRTISSNGFIPKRALDVASGTGDFAIKLYDDLKGECEVIGIDLSGQMLEIAKQKAGKRKISFLQANGEDIPFEDGFFDSVSCSYGIRNFDNPDKGLLEFHRVLKPLGRVVIVELSEPNNFLISTIFRIYFKYILPLLGGMVSGDKAAYSYLPKSVTSFPSRENFVEMMYDAGFKNCLYKNLFGGIATLYFGEKL